MPAIKALLAKLDWAHGLLLLVFLVTVGGPDVIKLENLFGLTGAAAATVKVVGFLGFLLTMAKQWKLAPDTIEAAERALSSGIGSRRGFAQLRMLAFVSLLGALFCGVVACKAFLASPVPADLQKDEECLAGQLLSGATDPVAMGLACNIPEGKTLTDALALLVDFLEGKLSAAQVTSLRGYVSGHRAPVDSTTVTVTRSAQ